MSGAIFLSASIPDPLRNAEFAITANTVAITSAINALLFVTLGRRQLIWGGHPAITPMVWETCEHFDVDYSSWVTLYQSLYFEEDFPEENKRFGNVVYTEKRDTVGESLLVMRTAMFSANNFSAGVFVGGMEGIVDEFSLLAELQSSVDRYPILSTGGAALTLADHVSEQQKLRHELDYVSLFHDLLKISPRERRYRSRDMQPSAISSRIWDRSDFS